MDDLEVSYPNLGKFKHAAHEFAVYIASNGGGNAWDNPGSYAADATWNNATPLA